MASVTSDNPVVQEEKEDVKISNNTTIRTEGSDQNARLSDEDDSSSEEEQEHDQRSSLPNICSPSSGYNITFSRPLLRPSAFKMAGGGGGGTAPSSMSAPSLSSFVLRPPTLIPNIKVVSCSPAKEQDASDSTTVPTFVPLEKEETEAPGDQATEPVVHQEKTAAPDNTFVFGRNLQERAVVDEERASVKRKIDESNSDAAKKKNVCSDNVVTGEENEVNVLQMHCRLFIFEASTSTWKERGRGLLRLNDSKDTAPEPVCSRLIIRTKGSLRVMLNTKIWDGMKMEKVSDKSVRLMAVDLDDDDAANNAVKIFLIMTTSVSDAETLTCLLESRVRKTVKQDN